jgi:ferrous iron transport protein B
VWSNASEFLKKAGTIIFALSVVLWALAYYPRLPDSQVEAVRASNRDAATAAALQEYKLRAEFDYASLGWHAHRDEAHETAQERAREAKRQLAMDRYFVVNPGAINNARKFVDNALDNAVAAAQSEYSFAGRFGHALQPVIRPLGYDWKMGVGLVAAFAAREVFVSTESIVYATGDTEEGGTAPLGQAMRADRYANGRPVWTPLVAVSLLVWFVLAMQCMSTVAIVRRETGGWGWPLFMILYMNTLAYVACLLVFQVGSRFFT